MVLLAGALGTGRLASRQTPLAPAPTTYPTTTSPTTTSTTRIPAAVKKVIPLDVQVHLGPAGFPDRLGMASDLAGEMKQCEGSTAQVRMWAQVLEQTWVLAAKEPMAGKDWICWSDALFSSRGSLFGGHGGSKDRRKLLQASQLTEPSTGKDWLTVVGGPVTREAVRLRILFRNGPPIDSCPSRPDPNSPSSSTPCSTSNQPRRPGCPNAWSPTTKPAARSPSAGQPPAKATSVTALKAPPSHYDTGTPTHSTLVALLHRRRLRPSSETVGMRTHRPRPAPATRSAFAGFRFPPDVIVLAVRWYLRFGLSYRDVKELLAELGVEVEVDHVIVYRWAQRFTPLLVDAAPTLPSSCWRSLVCRRDLRQGRRPLAVRLPGDRPVQPGNRRVRVPTARCNGRAPVLCVGHRYDEGGACRGRY
jgi:hypothetical protein